MCEILEQNSFVRYGMAFQLKNANEFFCPGSIRCKGMALKRLEYYTVIKSEFVCKIEKSRFVKYATSVECIKEYLCPVVRS